MTQKIQLLILTIANTIFFLKGPILFQFVITFLEECAFVLKKLGKELQKKPGLTDEQDSTSACNTLIFGRKINY